MRRIHATRRTIAAEFFPQHEIDLAKVAAIEAHLATGGDIPPVVVVQYGDHFMPIDGHHRLAACRNLARSLDAWIVPGARFEALDQRCRAERDFSRAEDFVICGGVMALEVAPRRRAALKQHGVP